MMAVAEQIRWPNDTHRTLVFGRTGSGKSVFGLWLLSTRSFDQKPWIIFDYKGDEIIEAIEEAGAPVIGLKKVPTKPGLYIVRPDPEEKTEVNAFLLQAWRQENTGFFFDEGFMVPQVRPYKAFDHIMTQGRSRNIPVIACYQRPAWLSQFAMSQGDFFAAFHILKPGDRELLGEYMNEGAPGPNGETIGINYRLPDHYCLWYDVGGDRAAVLKPVPPPEAIIETFQARLAPRRKGLFV